jgi:hypothetical protein
MLDYELINGIFESMSKKFHVTYNIHFAGISPYPPNPMYQVTYNTLDLDVFMGSKQFECSHEMIVKYRAPGVTQLLGFDIRNPNVFNEDHIHNSLLSCYRDVAITCYKDVATIR